MDISTPELECSDLALLLRSIDQHIRKKVDRETPPPTKTDYIEYSSKFPDVMYGLVSLLSRKSIAEHRYLWVRTLEATVGYANALSGLHRDVVYHARANSDVPPISREIKTAFSNLYSYIKTFFSQADEQMMLKGGSVYEETVRSTFCVLLCECFDLLENGREIVNDTSLQDAIVAVTTDSVVYVTQRNYESWEHKLIAKADIMQAIVALVRSSFHLGKPEQIKPLFTSTSGRPLITERFPFDFTAQLETDLPLLMDFYRYSGFCLATLAVSEDTGETIRAEYANVADYFLATLISLPNLNVAIYSAGSEPQTGAYSSGTAPASGPHQYISTQEREEISFFYVLNYLLRLENLSALIKPSPRLKTEISYFVKAFGKRISSDLDISASRNQSYSNSTISMLSLEQRASASAPITNSNTLSTILLEGSYKEKLHLVKLFFEGFAAVIESPHAATLASLVEQFNFKSVPEGLSVTRSIKNQDFHHLLSNINITQYPGKKLYVEAIEKIIRLVQLLTLTHLHGTLGLDHRPDVLLSYLFKTTYTCEGVTQVKDLEHLDSSDRLVFSSRAREPAALEINSQYDMLAATRELEQTLL